MYAIYRCDRRIPQLVAVCHTKCGTKIACRHFRKVLRKETCREVEVRYEEVLTYNAARIGYALINLDRKRQQKKLQRLEEKEHQAEQNSFAQRCKVASLY